MGETVLLYQLRALCALAGTGAAENEDDGDVGGIENGSRLGWLGELASRGGGVNLARHVYSRRHFVSDATLSAT